MVCVLARLKAARQGTGIQLATASRSSLRCQRRLRQHGKRWGCSAAGSVQAPPLVQVQEKTKTQILGGRHCRSALRACCARTHDPVGGGVGVGPAHKGGGLQEQHAGGLVPAGSGASGGVWGTGAAAVHPMHSPRDSCPAWAVFCPPLRPLRRGQHCAECGTLCGAALRRCRGAHQPYLLRLRWPCSVG